MRPPRQSHEVKSNFVASPVPSPQLLFHRSVLSIKNAALCNYSQMKSLMVHWAECSYFHNFYNPYNSFCVRALCLYLYSVPSLLLHHPVSGRLAVPRQQGLEYQTVRFVQSICMNSKYNLMINSACPAESEPVEPGCTARFLWEASFTDGLWFYCLLTWLFLFVRSLAQKSKIAKIS